MLHLVPPPGSSPKGRRGCPSPALSLTDDESRHLRAAIRSIARSYGNQRGLARALGLSRDALTPAHRRLGAALAVALWRLTGVPLDVLLRGKLAAVPAPKREPDGAA
jgi:hypothetical protein